MHPCMAQAREALKAALKEKSGALAVALEARDAARAKAAVLEENAEHARDEASALAQALSAAEVWSNRSRLLPCFETRQHSLPTPLQRARSTFLPPAGLLEPALFALLFLFPNQHCQWRMCSGFSARQATCRRRPCAHSKTAPRSPQPLMDG